MDSPTREHRDRDFRVPFRDNIQRAIERVIENYRSCTICERRCQVNRWEGELGFCKLPKDAFVYKEYLHLGEEMTIIPSHTFFLGGCSLRCLHCTDASDVELPNQGDRLDPVSMAEKIRFRRKQGARNVNFVGGEPDVNIYAILRLLEALDEPVPVIWNTNALATPFTLDTLTGIVSIYLADLKHGNDSCARQITRFADYMNVVRRNLLIAAERFELMVRHLVIPGHVACCTKPALEWLEKNLPHVTVNVMTGYLPFNREKLPETMNRRLAEDERAEAVDFLRTLNFRKTMIDGRWSIAPQDGVAFSPPD